MHRAISRWAGVLLATVMLSTPARAEIADEDGIKVAFLVNFAKYTEWPSGSSAGGLRFCGLSAQALSGKLAQLQGRQVQGREIQVRAPASRDEWRDCHVLYVAEGGRAEAVLRAVGQAPVLTVSDSPDFAQSGGIIGLKLRAGRMRFDINLGAARRAGLNLSSQLLKLADEVVQ